MIWVAALIAGGLIYDMADLTITMTYLSPWQIVPRLFLAAFVGVAGTIAVLTRG